MKIVRELDHYADLEGVQRIYDKGNKIAISFNEDCLLPPECVSLSENGDTVAEMNGTETDVEFVSGIVRVGKEIGFPAKGDLVVIDSVFDDTTGMLGYIKPCVGKYKDWVLTIMLLDDCDGTIADRVYEVTEDCNFVDESDYVSSKFEKSFERKVFDYCNENGIYIKEFNKFGHNEDGPLELELKYDLYLLTTNEKAEKLAKDLDMSFVDENGFEKLLQYSIDFPALMIEDEDYDDYDGEDLQEANMNFKDIIKSLDEFVAENGDHGGLDNESKFSHGIPYGFLGKCE